MNINDMKGKRAALVKEAREILDAAEKEKRSDLTAEENAKYTAIMADVDSLGAQITREEDLQKQEALIVPPTEQRTETNEDAPTFEKEVRSFLLGETRKPLEVRFTERELRDLTKGTTTEGGYTVPTGFVAKLYEHLITAAAIRQTNASVLVTSSGSDLQVPKTTTHPSAKLFAEAAQITETNPVFGQVTMKAYKYGAITQVSRELVEDTGVDLLGYLGKSTGRALGNESGKDQMIGDGSAKPKGVFAESTVGVTATGTNVVTTDELIDLYHSVIAPYRNAGSWLMVDSTLAHIRKKKDTTNQYLWQPGLAAGQPDTLLGRPLFTDPNIDALATGKKVIVFGDLSAYVIRDVGSVRFERSDDFAFDTDLITFKAIIRTDGRAVDTSGAFKHLITA